jgi:hypothetical protein
MDERKQEALCWLAAQVHKHHGATVDSGALYQALQCRFPDASLTREEVYAELVRLCRFVGTAIEFGDRTAA